MDEERSGVVGGSAKDIDIFINDIKSVVYKVSCFLVWEYFYILTICFCHAYGAVILKTCLMSVQMCWVKNYILWSWNACGWVRESCLDKSVNGYN